MHHFNLVPTDGLLVTHVPVTKMWKFHLFPERGSRIEDQKNQLRALNNDARNKDINSDIVRNVNSGLGEGEIKFREIISNKAVML
jgi:hypothetical protein